LQNLGRQRREIADVWTVIVTASGAHSRDPLAHPGCARFDCGTSTSLFFAVLAPGLKTRGVAADTHSRS
jgi:hypothetical protein